MSHSICSAGKIVLHYQKLSLPEKAETEEINERRKTNRISCLNRARFDERSRGVFATTSNSRIVKSGSQMRRTQRRPSRVPVHLEVVPSSSHSPDHSINFEPSLEPLQSSSYREEDPNRA